MKTKHLLLFMPLMLQAQESFPQEKQEQQGRKRIYDVGLTFTDVNHFGINFKIGSETSLFRIKALALNLESGNNESPIYSSYYYVDENGNYVFVNTVDLRTTVRKGGELKIGFEKRIDLMKKVQLSLGADLGCSYTSFRVKSPVTYYSWELDPSLSLVAGISYLIGDHLMITAEISPYLMYHFGRIKYDENGIPRDYPIHGFELGLTNHTANLTIAYRLTRIIYFKW